MIKTKWLNLIKWLKTNEVGNFGGVSYMETQSRFYRSWERKIITFAVGSGYIINGLLAFNYWEYNLKTIQVVRRKRSLFFKFSEHVLFLFLKK